LSQRSQKMSLSNRGSAICLAKQRANVWTYGGAPEYQDNDMK
jgi:hypothetical protein